MYRDDAASMKKEISRLAHELCVAQARQADAERRERFWRRAINGISLISLLGFGAHVARLEQSKAAFERELHDDVLWGAIPFGAISSACWLILMLTVTAVLFKMPAPSPAEGRSSRPS